MKKLTVLLFALLIVSLIFAVPLADSLLVSGKVLLDSVGIANVNIAGVTTDANGGFSFKIPAGTGSLLTPVYKEFLFNPPAYVIAAADTAVDSILFTAYRQVKKTIIISGQSNAEHVGHPNFFIGGEIVDNKIPYYLAYSGGEYGLSVLGLLTKFGKTSRFCKEYNRGFGIEMLLARTLYKNYSDSLAVMKMAYSGTALYDEWQPNGSTWLWFVQKHNNAVNLMRRKGYEPKYIGIFWFQGESDETVEAAPLYAANLHDLVDRMRARFPNSSEADELPFVLARIKWNPSSQYEEPVRAAQMDIVNHRTNTACVDVDDCHVLRYSNDNMHFNGNALNRIGYKLAVKYLELIGSPIDSNITVTVNLDEVMDTTVILTVEGDTSFTKNIDSLFEFPMTLGDSLGMYLNLGSEIYNYSPAVHNILYAYDQMALKDPTYTFNVNKVVAIEKYPDNMEYVLLNAYPNPFNPTTSINFQLPAFRDVRLSIYDVLGRKIATLVDMPMEAGIYRVDWHAGDNPSGLYIARLQTGGEVIFQKLTLLK